MAVELMKKFKLKVINAVHFDSNSNTYLETDSTATVSMVPSLLADRNVN